MACSVEEQFLTYQVNPEFSMRCQRGKVKELSSNQKERIETLWCQEREDLGSALYDGKIFSAIEVSEKELIGEFVSYKHFVACQRDPEIAEALQIQAVAVTGITNLEGCSSILVGRRSRRCLQDRNCYELLPSGGIEADCASGQRVCFKEQLYRELEEETSLGRDMVRTMVPFLLSFDKERQIWELSLHVTVGRDAEFHICGRPSEHQELLWLSRRDVNPFLQMHKGAIVPLTELLLRRRPTVGSRSVVG